MAERPKYEDFAPQIMQLRAEGMTQRQIGITLGLPYSTVTNWSRKARMAARPAKRPPMAMPSAEGQDLCAMDAAILASGATWAGRAAIAKRFAVPMGVVESRFHRLRVAGPRKADAPRRRRAADATATAPEPAPTSSVSASRYLTWTEERIAKAQAMRQQGCGGSDIGAALGVSRNAVLGMFRRQSAKGTLAADEVAK